MLNKEILKEQIKQQMLEQKQVGIIYHFTTLRSIFKILKDDKLKQFKVIKYNGKYYNSISFTRNKNLWYNRHPICIVVDGDKLSENYKIKPYNDFSFNKTRTDEQEETVLFPVNTRDEINNLHIYIKEILLNKLMLENELKTINSNIKHREKMSRRNSNYVLKTYLANYFEDDDVLNVKSDELRKLLTIDGIKEYIKNNFNINVKIV